MTAFFKWFTMGGYALYIWPAYALVVGVLLGNFWSIKTHKKRTRQFLTRWFTE